MLVIDPNIAYAYMTLLSQIITCNELSHLRGTETDDEQSGFCLPVGHTFGFSPPNIFQIEDNIDLYEHAVR